MLGTFINILFQMWTYLFGRPDDEIQRMDDKEHASKGTISVISSDSPRKRAKSDSQRRDPLILLFGQ